MLFERADPLQAIWSVSHTGFPPAAVVIFFAMSPTTLMSLFALSECCSGGYAIGKMSTPVMSNAGRYAVKAEAGFFGAWMITTGCFGSSCLMRSCAVTRPGALMPPFTGSS